MSGILCAFVGSGSSLFTSVSLTGINGLAWSDTNSGLTDTVSLVINSDGTFTVNSTVSGVQASGNWGTPTNSLAGANYWVRFTRTASGGTGGSSTATTAWVNLGSNQTVSVIANPTKTQTATYTTEVATDAAGTTIVATATGTQLNASGV
jgi:hypothetical protein